MPNHTRVQSPIRRKRQRRRRPSITRGRRAVATQPPARYPASTSGPSRTVNVLKQPTSSDSSLDWLQRSIERGRQRQSESTKLVTPRADSVNSGDEHNVEVPSWLTNPQRSAPAIAVQDLSNNEKSYEDLIERVLKAGEEDDEIEVAFTSPDPSRRTLNKLPAPSSSANITEILSAQEKALLVRNTNNRSAGRSNSSRTHHSRKMSTMASSLTAASSSSPLECVKSNWLDYISTELKRNPAFFTSTEARLEETGRVSSGGTSYASLRLTHCNSMDVREIYLLHHESKINAGFPTGVYDQLKTVVGQFARFCCVVQLADYRTLCETGEVYSLAAHMDAVRCFLQYFQLRSSPATVMTKCIHLRSLCDDAARYYSSESNDSSRVILRSIRNVSEYLKSVRKVEKRNTRRMARQKKTAEDRTARAVLFTEHDYSSCLLKAQQRMRGIMCTYDRIVVRKNTEAAAAAVSDLGLVNKWCVNFLPALMLWGGGQRPQVYADLLCPSALELEHFGQKAGHSDESFIELRPQHEKTFRSLDMPNVYFSTVAAPFISFHVQVIRKIILEHSSRSEEEVEDPETLMLDTRTGRRLRTPQIKHTFSAFLQKIDPELCSVTPMSLRGSFATIMFSKYSRKEVFKGWAEEDFLRALAKSMNTSVEQLRTTYTGIDEADFAVVARQITSVFERTAGDCEFHDDED